MKESEPRSFLIGLDCGTTNSKAVALRSDGVVAAEASRPNRSINPGPSMQEQDAIDWWQNAAAIFRSITAELGEEAAQIRAVSVSSHTVSLLPVDGEGTPLRHALIYRDTRSTPELNELVATIGDDRFRRIVGGQPSVAFLPSKLLWYKRHEPELFGRTAWVLQASSYLNYKLTGVFSSDRDQAQRTQCLDVATGDWSPEIGAALGIDLYAVLPPLFSPGEIIGRVTKAASAETGLPVGTPVLAGCSDALAAMLATGMSRLGEAGESSGTTSILFVGGPEQSPPDVPVVTRPSPVPEIPWLFDAPIQSSGAALRWYIDTMAAEERAYAAAHGLDIYDWLAELALQSPPGANGLFFFPYLMGERAPLWNDYASGMFIGLRMETTRSDLIRAVYEGVAYALRHALETVRQSGGRAELLRICGGGAKSRTWNRIKAAMFGIPVHVLDGRSGDVPVGDALLAGHAVGVFPDLGEAAAKAIHVAEIVEPDPDWAAVYDRLYPHYLELYRRLDPELRSLQQTLQELRA